MSETGSAAPERNGEIQPLVIYNCVHHRDDNPIDCTADVTAEIAAKVYNAAIQQYAPLPQGRMDNLHPLNFAGVGSVGLGNILNGELQALANIARGNAEALEVLLSNYEYLMNKQLTAAANRNADLDAALGALDTQLRAQAGAMPTLHRG